MPKQEGARLVSLSKFRRALLTSIVFSCLVSSYIAFTLSPMYPDIQLLPDRATRFEVQTKEINVLWHTSTDSKVNTSVSAASTKHLLCPNRQLRPVPYFSHVSVNPERWRTAEDATNVNRSRFSIVHPKKIYSTCEELEVFIEARNSYNEPKTHGGDYFRAKIYTESDTFLAGSSTDGEVLDHGNGTYSAFFTLKWSGIVQVEVKLMESCEAIHVFNRLKETAQPRLFFFGHFHLSEGNVTEKTRCNYLPLTSKKSSCTFVDKQTNITWYCIAPRPPLSCGNWVATESDFFPETLTEYSLGARDLDVIKRIPRAIIGFPSKVTVRGDDDSILINQVAKFPTCGPQEMQVTPQVAGFYYHDIWFPPTCKVRRFLDDEIKNCLANRSIYTFGDSTIRQLYGYLTKRVLGMDVFRKIKGQIAEADDRFDRQNNIHLYFRFHHVPIIHGNLHNVSKLRYVANEIDAISDQQNAVVVVSVWAHFQAVSPWYYEQRIRSIAESAQRLLNRNPNAVVMFKGANTNFVEKHLYYRSHMNDWYARENEDLLRRILLSYPDFYFLDSWDMSEAQLSKEDIHPKAPHAYNLMQQILSFLCPPL